LNTASPERNQVIDSIRALLICSVIVYHYFTRWAPPFSQIDLYHFDRPYPIYLGIGSFGVHAFFVISGLVITMTLEKSSSAFDFLYRRFSRLVPAFLACSFITFLCLRTWKVEGYTPTLYDYLTTLTLHPDKFKGHFVDGAYWSLAVEMLFYLWVAAFYAILHKQFWVGITAFGIAAIVQDIFGLHFANYYLFGSYVCFFLIGMSFWYFADGKNRAAAWSTLSVGALLFAIRASTLSDHYAFAVNCFVLSFIALLFLSVKFQFLANTNLAFLPYLGRISYALYLIHQEIGVLIIGTLKRTTSIGDAEAVLVAVAVSVALAALIFHYVEKPGQILLRELRSRHARSRPVAQSA
jgi:peptidoglycan/LPS O-acetylase OafA/YrhL